MLTFWTGADIVLQHQVIDRAMKKLVDRPEYRVLELQEDKLYVPEKGEVVLAMGNKALDLLQAEGIVPKNRKITSLRGIPREVKTAPKRHGQYLLTFDPFMVKMEHAKRAEIEWDVQLASRLDMTGGLDPDVGEYGYTDTLKYVIEYVKQKYKKTHKPVELSCDLETMGLYPYYPDKDIVSISFTPEVGLADVVYMEDIDTKAKMKRFLSEVDWLLNSPKVKMIGANFKFDLIWIAVKWAIFCSNFKADTLLMGSLVDENRSNSLNTHAKVYSTMGGYDDIFNASHDKSHMELVPRDELLLYAGGDTDACLRSYFQIKKQLIADRRLTKFYSRILQPASRAFERMEMRGLYVDQEEFAKLRIELVEVIEELEEEALGMIPKRIKLKYTAKSEDDFKLSRNVIIKDFLFSKTGLGLKPKMLTAKTKQPSTAYDHLMMFEDHEIAGPFITLFKKWNATKKTLSTYVDGFLKHLRPDGRFHPTYALYAGSLFENKKDDDAGTVSGRTSAKEPAVQTIPKHTIWAKPLRMCYPALPGFTFFQVDFSQGELRVIACVAKEKNMLKAYHQGMDLHALTGSHLAGYTYEDFIALGEDHELFQQWRQRAKAANFGLLYGMKHLGYREYARTSFGVEMSVQDAFQEREDFFVAYPGLLTYHTHSIKAARKYGSIRSPLGRVRHLPLIHSEINVIRSRAERQAINSPIQSCLSDMCLWSLGIMEEEFGDCDEVQPVGMTHDSIYGYIETGKEVYWLTKIKNIMEGLPYQDMEWKPELPFPVDCELGPNMAQLEKIKL